MLFQRHMQLQLLERRLKATQLREISMLRKFTGRLLINPQEIQKRATKRCSKPFWLRLIKSKTCKYFQVLILCAGSSKTSDTKTSAIKLHKLERISIASPGLTSCVKLGKLWKFLIKPTNKKIWKKGSKLLLNRRTNTYQSSTISETQAKIATSDWYRLQQIWCNKEGQLNRPLWLASLLITSCAQQMHRLASSGKATCPPHAIPSNLFRQENTAWARSQLKTLFRRSTSLSACSNKSTTFTANESRCSKKDNASKRRSGKNFKRNRKRPLLSAKPCFRSTCAVSMRRISR